MGTLKEWPFGGTAGADVTIGNSGLTLVNRDGGTIKFIAGGGVEFITKAAGGYTIGRGAMAANDPVASFLGAFTAPANPAANLAIGYIRNGTDDIPVVRLAIIPGLSLQIWDKNNVLIGGGSLSTLSAGTEYQITIVLNTTTGSVTARLYDASGALVGVERSGTGIDLGTAVGGFEIGVTSSNAATTVVWQSIKMEDARATEIPPFSAQASGFTAWDGIQEQDVTPSVWNGTQEVAASAYMMPYGYSSAASMINSADTFYIAHRGGSDNWPEMSLRAYTNSAAWGVGALEISCNRTSDAVWVGVHDETLQRTSPGAPATPIGDMTFAQVQEWTNQGEPYERLETILEAYGSSHVVVLDPKYGGWDMTGFLDLILTYTPPANVVIKFFHSATDVAQAAHDRGLLTWGYYYQDSADQIPITGPYWDFLGMDYTADQAAWDIALGTGKKVVGHIINSAAAATTAISKGAAGLMVSDVTDVITGPTVPIGS